MSDDTTIYTSVPIVVDRLAEVLRERGWQVEFTGGTNYPDSVAILGDTVEGAQDWAGHRSSWHPREETYMQEVTFNIVRDHGRDARIDAFAGMKALGDQLSEDPSLGLSPAHPTLRMRVAEFRNSTVVEPQGHRSILTVLVHVAVRLSRN